jgi:RNA polymerase primary sigma factor
VAGIRAQKNGASSKKTVKKAATKKVVAKKSAVKKTAKKAAPKKIVKKSTGPHRFPTKAELEARKLAEANKGAKKTAPAASGKKLFPTKAELEAKRLAALGVKPVVEGKPGKPIITKIDGEEVELEEVELEDLETLVEEVKEIIEEEKENEIRVVNVAEESQNEENAFTIKDSEEDDAPVQTVLTAGATADPVKDYLKLIGRVPLLNAEMEVDLSLRVEAGLFAEEIIKHEKKIDKKYKPVQTQPIYELLNKLNELATIFLQCLSQ